MTKFIGSSKISRVFVSFVSMVVLLISMMAMTSTVTANANLIHAPIRPIHMVTGTEAPTVTQVSFSKKNILKPEEDLDCGVVRAIRTTMAGTLKLELQVLKLQKNVTVELYTDAACTNRITTVYSYITQGETGSSDIINLSNPGTYYLLIKSDVYSFDGDFENSFNIKTSFFTYSTKTIKNGQTIHFVKDSKKAGTFKFVAPKTGTLTVTPSYNEGTYITLRNSKNKTISDKEWCCPYLKTYPNVKWAVEKGKTYYIYMEDLGEDISSINVKVKTVKEKSGSKRKKAVSVKRKKKISGIIASGTKDADWYKIKIKKKQKFTVYMGGSYSGTIKLGLYNSKGKLVSYGSLTRAGKFYTYSKIPKGRYYFKISSSSKKNSASYTMRWK